MRREQIEVNLEGGELDTGTVATFIIACTQGLVHHAATTPELPAHTFGNTTAGYHEDGESVVWCCPPPGVFQPSHDSSNFTIYVAEGPEGYVGQ